MNSCDPGPGIPATLGLGPYSGVSIGRLSGVGALWDCVPRVCGGEGGCAGGGVPLGAVLCCPGAGCVSRGYTIIMYVYTGREVAACRST